MVCVLPVILITQISNPKTCLYASNNSVYDALPSSILNQVFTAIKYKITYSFNNKLDFFMMCLS